MAQENGTAGTESGADRQRRRWKLWEVDVRFHCSVVGTCLTLGDLRRIIAKLGLTMPDGAEDYDIHAHFVASAGRTGPLTKAMHKTLDRKYEAAIRRFGRVRDADELAALWRECVEDGDIPGPYWALVTHPFVDETTAAHAYRRIHMLSHLVGSVNRADIRRLRALETERDALVGDLAKLKHRQAEKDADLRRLRDARAAEVRQLKVRLRSAEAVERRLVEAEARVRELEDGTAMRALEARVEALARERADAAQRADDAEALRRDNAGLRQALETATAECGALEAALANGLDVPCPRNAAAMDLSGRRIVYVGGRAGLIPHLRALVEHANGIFIHHDGGIEDNGDRLGDVLARGDAVLCPVDCVSHTACRLAKQMCKRHAKAFVPLRSSGLSSFVSGLREIAA